jgi:hypothetical protein
LEDAVEDAVISLAEQGTPLPSVLNIWYPEVEWPVIERFHRLRIRKDRKIGVLKDRFPFIRTQVLGISVSLMPEPKYIETIH